MIASQRVGAGARSSADLAELAVTAFAQFRRRLAQHPEQAGVLIDVHQRIVADIAAGNRQVTAGIDFAGVRDEHEAPAIADRGGSPKQPAIDSASSAMLNLEPLGDIAPVVQAFGGFASAVSGGVALGVTLVRSPTETLWRAKS